MSSLGDDLLSSEGSLGLAPSRLAPPGLDLLDFLLEELVLNIRVDGRVVHVVGSHGECGRVDEW